MDGESPVSMGLAYGLCAHLREAGSPGGLCPPSRPCRGRGLRDICPRRWGLLCPAGSPRLALSHAARPGSRVCVSMPGRSDAGDVSRGPAALPGKSAPHTALCSWASRGSTRLAPGEPCSARAHLHGVFSQALSPSAGEDPRTGPPERLLSRERLPFRPAGTGDWAATLWPTPRTGLPPAPDRACGVRVPRSSVGKLGRRVQLLQGLGAPGGGAAFSQALTAPG